MEWWCLFLLVCTAITPCVPKEIVKLGKNYPPRPSNSICHPNVNATRAASHYAFLLRNGTGFTPSTPEQFLEYLPIILTTQSIAFLLWIEEFQIERPIILQQASQFPVTGNSAHLVNKLFRHAALTTELESTKTLTEDLESGDFVFEFANMDRNSRHRLAISKAVLRRAFARYRQVKLSKIGAKFDPIDAIDFANNLKDLFEGLQNGDWESVTFAYLLIFGQYLDFVSDGLEFLDDAGKLIGPIGAGDIISIAINIYNIVGDIKDLINGNLNGLETAITIISLIENVVGIAITILTMFFPVLAPLGFIFSAIFGIISAILEAINKDNLANHHVMKLGQYISLSESEKSGLYDDYMDGKEVDEDLVRVIQQAQVNLALVGNYLDFLTNNTMFERVIFPAAFIEGSGNNAYPKLYVDSEADLRQNVTFCSERWAPKLSIMGITGRFEDRIICTPENTNGCHTTRDRVNDYKCKYAIGVSEYQRRTGNMTLIALGNGTDTALGTTDFPNLFIIEKGTKHFSGGNGGDLFLVQSDTLNGGLDGGGGNDVLKLVTAYITSTDYVLIDLSQNRMTFEWSSVTIDNFEVIHGREKLPETITATCSTKMIDGLGGSQSKWDQIIVPPIQCDFELWITINTTTQVDNAGKAGTFYYNISKSLLDAETEIIINSDVESKHFIFMMETPLERYIQNISVEDDWLRIRSETGLTATSSVVFANETTGYYEPSILFPDDIVVKINKDKIVTTIFTLNNPNATGHVRAPRFGQAIFLLNTTIGQIVGGAGDDLILLQGFAYAELISGQGGTNKLMLDSTFHPDSVVQIDMVEELLNFVDMGSGLKREIKTLNIGQALGRSESVEHVIVGCGDTFVDGQGGVGIGEEDLIEIVRSDCDRSLFVRSRRHTIVRNNALDGNFVYFVSFDENLQFDFSFRPNLNHTFQLDFALSDIQNVSIDLELTKIAITASEGASVLELPLTTLDSANDSSMSFFSQPLIITNDKVFLKAGRDGVPSAVFHLNNASETVQGAPFAPNIFIINGSVGSVIGGDFVDLFMLQNGTASKLNGGLGKDRFVLHQDFRSGTPLVIDFRSEQLFRDADIDESIRFTSIEEFVGRNGSSEHVKVSCNLLSVDGVGGSEIWDDIIEIASDPACDYDVMIVVRPFQKTVTTDLKSTDKLTYVLQAEGTFDFTENAAESIVVLPLGHEEFTSISFSNLTEELRIEAPQPEKIYSLRVKRNESAGDGVFHLSPRVLSKNLVEFKVDNKGEITAIFNVKENSTNGFEQLKNLFFVGPGSTRNIVGGLKDDTFLIANTSTSCYLFGEGGSNTIRISNDIEGDVVLMPMDAECEGTLNYDNITHIIGRNGSMDTIFADCNVKLIDGNGGSAGGLDQITIPPLNCSYNLNIVVRDFTHITNQSPNGSFFYSLIGLEDSEVFKIHCNDCENATHTIATSFESSLVSQFKSNNETCEVQILTNDGDTYRFQLDGARKCKFPRLLFFDGIAVETSRLGALRISHQANHSNVQELLNEFTELAVKWNSSIMILTEDGSLLSIGSPGFDLLHSSPEIKTYLVGNGGANIYVIGQRNTSQVIAKTFIYCGANGTEVIDLNQLVRPIREKAANSSTSELYIPGIELGSADELILEVWDEDVMLSQTIVHNWRNAALRFLLSSSLLQVVVDENSFISLVPIPIELDIQKHVVIDEQDLEDNTRISVATTLPDGPASIVRSGQHLVITNTLNMTTDPNDAFTMVFTNQLDNIARPSKSLPKGVVIQFANDNELSLDTIVDGELLTLKEAQQSIQVEVEKEVFAFQCPAEGLFNHPKNCNNYYRCILVNDKLIAVQLPCPAGTIFCEGLNVCDSASASCECRPYLEEFTMAPVNYE